MRLPWFGVLFFALGCAGAPPADDAGAVRAAVARLIAADNARDLETVMSCYAEDAILLPPNDAPAAGHAAIRPRYATLFEQFQPEITCVSEETLVGSDFAIDRGITQGRLLPRAGGEPRSIDDKYAMILRREASGRWLVQRLIWNSNRARP